MKPQEDSLRQHIIEEYTAQHARWREGKRISIGRPSSRRDERDYLDALCEQIGYTEVRHKTGVYKVINIPGRVEAVQKELKKANRLESGAQYFARLYRDQTRTRATPKEREAILQGLTASGDMWTDEEEDTTC